jgi:hypothetical protein
MHIVRTLTWVLLKNNLSFDNIDPCASNPCVHSAHCVKDENLGYRCEQCDSGYYGPKCEECKWNLDIYTNQFISLCLWESKWKLPLTSSNKFGLFQTCFRQVSMTTKSIIGIGEYIVMVVILGKMFKMMIIVITIAMMTCKEV